jgi:hypothetical protein
MLHASVAPVNASFASARAGIALVLSSNARGAELSIASKRLEVTWRARLADAIGGRSGGSHLPVAGIAGANRAANAV